MTGFHVSASAEPPAPNPGERILVSVPNWIGDGIMSMPALQALHDARPDLRIELLVKPRVAPLWRLHEVGRNQIPLCTGPGGLAAAAREARANGFARAYAMPHSVRSALPLFLAGIPFRIGTSGRLRSPLLTHIRHAPTADERRHQAWEYMRLLSLDAPETVLPPPRLQPTPESLARAEEQGAGLPTPRFGLMPGAARGPSKRWPADSFCALAHRLVAETGGSVVVMGAAGEQTLCQSVAEAAGERGRNFAGQTDLTGWAALIRSCSVVMANDSGGMHMAAALDVPVVAVFGATDPEKTGPLGTRSIILQADAARKNRDIARADAEAARALAAITPERVAEACLSILAETKRRSL